MLDAHQAPDAHARPALPAARHRPVRIAGPSGRGRCPVRRGPNPAAGPGGRPGARRRDPPGCDDAGPSARRTPKAAWVWKDAYEAAEAAVVLFVQRYGRAMRQRAGADADGPRTMLAMLDAVAALEPSHTKRSDEQVRLQQFSTPLPLAYAALKAAAIRPGGTVLEPSARHRHAGGDGGVRPRQGRRQPSASQRIRRDPRPPPDPALSPGDRHRLRRGSHRRPAPRRPADGGADEPTVFRDAGRRPHSPPCRPAPPPLGIYHAAGGRAARRHHLVPLRPGATPPGGTPSARWKAAPAQSSPWPSTAGPMPGGAPASTPGSPSSSARPSLESTSTGRRARPTPAHCSTPSSRVCRRGSRSARTPPGPSRPAQPATSSASRPPPPATRHRTGTDSAAAPVNDWGVVSELIIQTGVPDAVTDKPADPAHTGPLRSVAAGRGAGAGHRRASDAAGAVRRHGPRCRIPCRHTARCCRSAW